MNKKVALQFAFQGIKDQEEGKVPVLFRFEKLYNSGRSCAFLNTRETSAFHEEQEYLIGNKGFQVKNIEVKKEFNFLLGKDAEVTVILLK